MAHFASPSIHGVEEAVAVVVARPDNVCLTLTLSGSDWRGANRMELDIFFPGNRAAYVEAIADAINQAGTVSQHTQLGLSCGARLAGVRA